MTDANPKNPYHEPDDAARMAMRTIVCDARYASLATLAPETGHPNCSRVGLATMPDNMPFILVSGLAAHTGALMADPRCSLLVGEVAKGDPLASPRVSLTCRALEIERNSSEVATARSDYLDAHPKAKLYIDLADFMFFKLEVIAINYIAGFGRAYHMTAQDLAG